MVKLVLPAGWHRFESPGTSRARVAWVDLVCGSPDGDLAEKFVAEVAVEWRPGGIGGRQDGLFFDEVGEVGDELAPVGQVASQDGVILKVRRNSRYPRQWARPL
jgi:hypothetical protein